jgi:hypothetical protein
MHLARLLLWTFGTYRDENSPLFEQNVVTDSTVLAQIGFLRSYEVERKSLEFDQLATAGPT